MGDLVSLIRDFKPGPLHWEHGVLARWTTREVPEFDRFSGHADTALLIFSCLLLLWFLSALASHHWQLAALLLPVLLCSAHPLAVA